MVSPSDEQGSMHSVPIEGAREYVSRSGRPMPQLGRLDPIPMKLAVLTDDDM
jgi:hypothetical protein